MEIILAKNIGFCFGVRRAYKKSLSCLDNKKCQMLGQLVHNKSVVDTLRKKGLLFIDSPYEAKKGTVIIRAHGASKETLDVLKNKQLEIVDTTCILVKKAQKMAQDLEKQGKQVVIIGDKKHDEIKSIQGNLKHSAIVVEKKEDLEKIDTKQSLGVVAQTTQDEKIINDYLKILKKKFNLIYKNTLCPSVLKRQKETVQLSKKVDLMLVIGSKNSANTQRLVEIAKKYNKKVFNIETEKQIKINWFNQIKKIGIISGTSAPDWVIKKIINKIYELEKKKNKTS